MPKTLEEERREGADGAARLASEIHARMGKGLLRDIPIAMEISRLRRASARAAKEVVACNKSIAELQKKCPHRWKFSWQVNDHHEHNWNVTYKCTECDAERTDKSHPPVCEVCNCALNRASADDSEAQEAVSVAAANLHHWNPPLPFRCPTCREIHILWHEGD